MGIPVQTRRTRACQCYVLFIVAVLLITSFYASALAAQPLPTLERYYPDHSRPEYLYHGVDPFQMDEFELMLVMLDIRPVAVLSNYGLSVLSSQGLSLRGQAERFLALRSDHVTTTVLPAIERLFDKLIATDLIQYAIDYLYVNPAYPSPATLGGEGYPPLPVKQLISYKDVPPPPTITEEPNGLEYNLDTYPKFYRINVYTSEYIEIAQLFGPIVLKLRDRDYRGLSLPRYAQYKHGPYALLDERATAYNGATNADEYVFPGCILSSEVVEAYFQENFKMREFGNTIKRIYTRVIIDGQSFVTIKNNSGRILLQVGYLDGKLKYRTFIHPDKIQGVAEEIKPMISRIDAFNGGQQ